MWGRHKSNWSTEVYFNVREAQVLLKYGSVLPSRGGTSVLKSQAGDYSRK